MDRSILSVVSTGTPYERGRHLGHIARPRVRRAVQAYLALFRAQAGLRREQVLAAAERFMPVIEAGTPHLMAEIRGIADGSESDVREIVALNARTEILYGCTPVSECTALSAVGPSSADGQIRIGQNWDWHPAMAGNLVLWTHQRDEGPDVVTLAEAGMVGKIGVNAAGLALCVNLLVADGDHPGPALPMHLVLRHLLDSANTVDEAVALLRDIPRCTSCNHLLTDRTGAQADVEATPTGVAVHPAVNGFVAHTNHCLDQELAACDRNARESTGTFLRYERLSDLAAQPLDDTAFRALLSDHGNAPDAICRHDDMRQSEQERSESVASLIFNLTSGTLDLADGPPCSSPYQRHALGSLLRGSPFEL